MPSREHPPSSGVLKFDEIEEGISDWGMSLEPADLDFSHDGFAFSRAIHLNATVSRSTETFTIQGVIDCQISGECCRCLTTIEQSASATFRLLIQRREASEEELEATVDQEIEILDPGAREFDLKKHVREEIILELPQRLYCRTECRGLCSQCGTDLNQGPCSCSGSATDSRWEALGKIQFN